MDCCKWPAQRKKKANKGKANHTKEQNIKPEHSSWEPKCNNKPHFVGDSGIGRASYDLIQPTNFKTLMRMRM